MNDLRDWLKDADPVVNEPPLSEADALRMRRAIVAEGESPQSVLPDWPRGSWATATVVVALTIALSISGSMGSRTAAPETTVAAGSDSSAPQLVTRRQMQLIAPGGTRVIWIFNDDFKP